MNLKDLQKNWDEFGKIDPLWAILVDPNKRFNKWERREFFKTGEDTMVGVMKYLTTQWDDISNRKALDFGCGVGRITQALAKYFGEVYGVDIAPSMIKLANEYNQHHGKCHYLLNPSDNLRLFKNHTFDFIFSDLVLQHMEPKYSRRYIKEFIRILATGGLIFFQVPCEQAGKSKSPRTFPKMEMHAISVSEVKKWIEKFGWRLVEARMGEPRGEWRSCHYLVTK